MSTLPLKPIYITKIKLNKSLSFSPVNLLPQNAKQAQSRDALHPILCPSDLCICAGDITMLNMNSLGALS